MLKEVPSRSLEKAIFEPSGDHAGKSSSAGLLVRLTGLLPSALIEKMSALPLRSLEKASLLESGDQVGKASSDSRDFAR
ncbi:MAG TPA: hypothetical protein VGO91_16710 [Pyrinomonadaceae bacterium]|jgi:hypothetical protein|nr:hypothetical protein [Pyrinomonadaceae bacterium]